MLKRFMPAICFYLLSVPIYAQEDVPAERNLLVNRVLNTQSSSVVCTDELATLDEEVKRLQLEKAKLTLEYEKKLLELQQQKDKLSLENELSAAKQEQTLAQLNATKTKLELENTIAQLEKNKLLMELETSKNRLEFENTIREQEKKKRQVELEDERDKLVLQNAILEEKNKQLTLNVQVEIQKLDLEMKKIEFEKGQLDAKIAEREQQELWDSQVNRPKEYLKEPFINGKLTISDRKIVLDEVIWPGTANYVIDRLEYYNNKNTEYPIFLMMDYCSGGSVMEGMKIVKAMQSSRAPVYVVVKSLAASMAAVITALAKKSFAYPNAMIVHHQVTEIYWGESNQTEQQERLKILSEWTHRTLEPVAKKMGLTLEELIKRMYQHNSIGNWIEFANEAVKLKWIDYVVEDLRDTSFIKQPKERNEEEKKEGVITVVTASTEKTDEQGHRYLKVPHLRPFDAYHLYNPDNYFRY